MLTGLLLALCLLPQGETTLAGRVLDDAGKPVAAALVTLLHRPLARHDDASTEHRVVAHTDARGSFRVTLHEATLYSVWAVSADAASPVAEGITAGGFLELCTEANTAAESIRVTGLDAWNDAATFRYRALVGSEHVDFVPLTCRDAILSLPPLPRMESRAFEILTADGRLLWANQADRTATPATLTLPPPRAFTVQVNDAAGAPLRDVEVLAHVRNYWVTQSPAVPYGDRFRALWPSQSKTDEKGHLQMRMPQTDGARSLWLLTRKDGYTMSVDGVHNGKRCRGGREIPAAESKETEDHFDIVLTAAPPQTVALQQPDGSPFAADTLYLVARVHLGNSGTPLNLALPVVNGQVTLLSPLPTGADTEIAWTVLAPPLRSALQSRHGFAPPTQFRLPDPAALFQAKAPPIDLANWHELRLIAADGRPAANTIVQLREKLDSVGTMLRTDRLGRLLFELRCDTRVSVFAQEGTGGLSIAAGKKEPTQLALRAMHTVAGQVVDHEGKAAGGVRIACAVTGGDDGDILAKEHQLLSGLLPAVRSNAEGRFELLLPPFTAQVQLTATARERARRATTTVEWEPSAPPKIEIALERR